MNTITYDKIVTVLIFIGILSTYPYVFDCFLPLPGMQLIAAGILGLLILLLPARKIKPLPTAFTVCVAVQMGVWFVYSFLHNDTSYFTRIFFLLLTYVVILSLNSSKGVEDFIKKNNWLIAIQAILGLVAFLLIFIGVLPSIFSFENVDGRTAQCFGLTCSNAVYGNVIRSAGYFDEPGALASWGVYALIFNELYIKNTRVEKMLVVGLISTLSMAYFIQLAMYLICFKINLRKSSLVMLAMLITAASAVNSLGEGNPLYDMTFGRFEIEKYGHGETAREILMEESQRYYRKNPIFGNGAQTIENIGYMGDNPYETLATDGIVGTIIIYLPLLIVLLRNIRRKEFVFAVLVIAAGYLQRPFHLGFLHYIMLFSFCYLGLKYKGEKYEAQSFDNHSMLQCR